MKNHYNINDIEWEKLKDSGVTISDLVTLVPEFKIHIESESEVSWLSLLYVIDNHGDFTDTKCKEPIFKIAMAVFNSLSSEDKIQVINYLSFVDEGDT